MLARRFIRFTIAASLSLPSIAEAAMPELELRAPGGCPSEAELESFVAARLSSDSASAPGIQFDVEVTIVGDRHVATLSSTPASGEASRRTLEDPSCVELLKSVAFVVAVAVERERDEQQRQRTADADTHAATPAAPALEARTPAAAARPERDRRRQASAPRARAPAGPGVSLLAGVRGSSAPAPEFAPAARLAASVSFPGVTPTPSVHVSALRTLPQAVVVDPSTPDRGGNFTWSAAAIEGCAGTPAGAGAAVTLSGCLGTELGLLSADGDGVFPSHTRHRFWLDIIALGRLRFPAETPLGLEVDGGATIPLTRDQFVIEGPRNRLFQPPPVALSLGLGLSLRVL